MSAITLRDYLRGKVSFDVGGTTMDAVFADRGVSGDSSFDSTSVRLRELCLADLYVWYAVGKQSGTVEDAHGVWRHKESIEIGDGDRRRLLSLANVIYSRYGEPRVGSRSVMKSFGMRWVR